jgi:LisH domain-containing protein ARMC9
MKLEFYLRIYFAVYPSFMSQNSQQQNEKDLRRELAYFKDFLDSAGSYLSKTSEFLQYYALPYVDNPLMHPIFRNVCTKKWATDLRNKLREFLQANISKNQSPQLFHWYAHFKKKTGLHVAEGHEMARADGNSPEAEELKEQMIML